jgi:hypothetical protein
VRTAALSSGRRSALLALLALPLAAQGTKQGSAEDRRIASGTLQRASGDTAVPVAGAWVVLHRVASDGGAPLDSTLTDARGRFVFRYRATVGDDAIYFASSSYGGIAYFTSPLPPAPAKDEVVIVVYDTTSRALPIRVRGRHIIAGGPAEPGRTIIEVYEISNDSSLTLVSGRENAPTFSMPVLPHAKSFRARDSDVAADAISMRNGRVEVHAPLAPGIKQIAFSYIVPESDTKLRFAIGSDTPVLELLTEEPMARVGGAALVEQDPVTIEGRTFKRFLSQNPPRGAVASIDLPEQPLQIRQMYLAVVILAVGVAMLAALARASMRRR